jgi:hypothetical protein
VAEDADLHPIFFDDAGEEPGVEGAPEFFADEGGGGEGEAVKERGGVGALGGKAGDEGFTLGAGAAEGLEDGFFFGEETAVVFRLFEGGVAGGVRAGVGSEGVLEFAEFGAEGGELLIAKVDEGLDVADVDGLVGEGLGGFGGVGRELGERVLEAGFVVVGGDEAGFEVGDGGLEMFDVAVLREDEALAFVAGGFEGDDLGILRVSGGF